MKTCSHAKFQVKSCYGYWVTLLHEEEAEAEAEADEEDEEFVKSCFTCIPYLVWHFHSIFCMQLLFYMFFTLMSLKDRLRLKLKVKTKISLCMAIMLDNPWQSGHRNIGALRQYEHTSTQQQQAVSSIIASPFVMPSESISLPHVTPQLGSPLPPQPMCHGFFAKL